MAVVLSVVLEAVPGREEELGRKLAELVNPTRNEPGCFDYQLSEMEGKLGTYLFYEKFADQAALDRHLAMPYFQDWVNYQEKSNPVASVDVKRWKSVV